MSWNDLVALASERGSSALAVAGPAVEPRSWSGDGGLRPIESMSVTKFVVGAVVGAVLGVDSLETPIGKFVSEWEGDARGRITLRAVVTHTSGLESLTTEPIYAAQSVNELVLASQQTEPPGTFRYNNLAVHLVGLVLERATGRHLNDIAAQQLFEPLGFGDWHWQSDEQGSALCMAGLQVLAPDLAQLGTLYLTGGRHNGGQLVPEAWIEATPPIPPANVGLLCFAQFGPARVGFGHDGDLGQYLSIQPELGLVGVRQRVWTEQDDPHALWEQFPGDVHHVYGSDGAR